MYYKVFKKTFFDVKIRSRTTSIKDQILRQNLLDNVKTYAISVPKSSSFAVSSW